MESSKADVFLGTKKPTTVPSLATVAYWVLVALAVLTTLIAIAITFG